MPTSTTLAPELLTRIDTLVNGVRGELVELARILAAEPELAYAEHASSARCAELLATHGLTVTHPAFGMATAFTATAGTSGPHVVICAEYDALPEVGQACGHNLIAGSAVGAGIALAAVAQDVGLRVTVLGTPAEETGGGKVDLIRAGAFEGVDAALMVHPEPFDNYGPGALAIEEWKVTVHGRTAHASGDPELGINALDGLVAGYTAIAMLRQHLRPHQQVHGVITRGGAAPNIVPDHTEALYYLRAIDAQDLEDLRTRVRACLEGGAAAAGASVSIESVSNVYEPLRPHAGLIAAFTAACEAIGRVPTEQSGNPLGGSTDFGNVSQLVPGLHANMSINSWPASNHQAEFAAHTLTEDGTQMMLDAAQALALTACQIAANPAILTP